MSAATLDEYTSDKSRTAEQPRSKDTILAERARILETVARKAQDKTLTLQETTDLYARFNQTYESAYQKKSPVQEDESWALKLLEDCARENDAESALKTRVNGEPFTQKPLQLLKASRPEPASLKKTAAKQSADTQSKLTLNQALFEEELSIQSPYGTDADKPKLSLRDAFIYDQFNFNDEEADQNRRKRANRRFWFILALSGLFTCAALIAASQIV